MSEVHKYAYFEGNFVPIEEAKVSITNLSWMYGAAIFEGIRGYWNEKKEEMYLFRMPEHYERMEDSMKIMRMTDLKYSPAELGKITTELLRRNTPRTDTYVRVTVFKNGHRIGPVVDSVPTDVCIFTAPFGDYFHGVGTLKVQVSSWRRVEDNAIPARAKIVGAYANTAMAKSDAVAAGFDECIVLSENGHVSEGSAMNLFMVKRGVLITTPVFENILPGVTRASVLEICQNDLGIKTECRQIDRSELYTADELFFTGTGAQIAAITEVDRRNIGDGKAGLVAKRIMEAYTAVCRGENAKYSHWLTPVYAEKNAGLKAAVK